MDFLDSEDLKTLASLGCVEDVSTLVRRSFCSIDWLTSNNSADRKGWISSIRTTRYCPVCLSTDEVPYTRSAWRFHCAPVCPLHKVVLQKGCWKCGYSLPLLTFNYRAVCAKCNCNLANSTNIVRLQDYQNVCNLISYLIQVLSGTQRPWQGVLKPRDFFDILLFAITYYNLYLARTGNWSDRYFSMNDCLKPPFDWRQNNTFAVLVVERSLAVIDDWPRNFVEFVRVNRTGVNAVSAQYSGRVPLVIKSVIEVSRSVSSHNTPTKFQIPEPKRTIIDIEPAVKDAITRITQEGKCPYLKTVHRIAGISYKKLKRDSHLKRIINQGIVSYRAQEKRRIIDAIAKLKSRGIPITASTVGMCSDRSWHYIKKYYGNILPQSTE